MEEGLLFDIPIITPEKSKIRRRSRTSSCADPNICNRTHRLEKRNKILVTRYYYYTEIKRRRFDDVISILSDNEFFVDYRTISNTLLEWDEYYHQLIREKASVRKLARLYPGFDWTI